MLIYQTSPSWKFPKSNVSIQVSSLPQALFNNILLLIPLIFSTLNYLKKKKQGEGELCERENCVEVSSSNLQGNQPFLLLLCCRKGTVFPLNLEVNTRENRAHLKIWVRCHLTISFFFSTCIKHWELPFLLWHPLKIGARTPCPRGSVLIKGCLISH